MRFIGRWIFRFLILCLVLATALLLLKDTLGKSAVENRLRSQTGLDVRIGRMEIGLFTPTVTIDNLKIYNRAEFGGLVLADLPELHVEYDRRSLLDRRLHIRLLRLNVAEINIVRDAKGRNNIEGLPTKDSSAPKRKSTTHAAFDFAGIDLLNLSLGKLKYTDLKQPANNREFNLGVRQEIVSNVNSVEDLYSLAGKVLLEHARELWDRSSAAVPSAPKGAGKPPSPSLKSRADGLAGPRKP